MDDAVGDVVLPPVVPSVLDAVPPAGGSSQWADVPGNRDLVVVLTKDAAISQELNASLVVIFPKLSLPVAAGECYPRLTQHESFASLYMKLFAKSAGSSDRTLYDTQLYPYPLQQSVYINDFPCPSHILITMRDHFRQEFTFNQRILNEAKAQVAAALKAVNNPALTNATIVTVHVRRTDYLAHVQNYYGQSPVKDIYYQRAFNFFRNRTNNPVFVVASDDPEWCKKNFRDKDIVYGAVSPVKRPKIIQRPFEDQKYEKDHLKTETEQSPL
ncbi:galactoside alpha-(1,2)-fucosyltransferase 1-like [Procambarus clarkii]|uniref:galactoside alpha-(1,2)-fucosyltransferase 1-like n=1 Tax=Procambarus clarkii TaxID=6728 RepID=UPI0037447CA0